MFVLTHDQLFHADDVLAVAILKKINNNIQLIRTRNQDIIELYQNDANATVLDVGNVYNPKLSNFDHHQDLSLPSAAGLIWMHFGKLICTDDFSFNYINNTLIKGIDAWDLNRDDIHTVYRESISPNGVLNLSMIIKGFNHDINNSESQDQQFMKAVDFTLQILDNSIESAKVMLEAEKTWESRKTLKNGVLVFDAFCPIWKSKVFESGSNNLFAVLPNEKGFAICALDSSMKALPTIKHKDLIFQHKANFLAVLSNKAAALKVAESL